jgi:hypothetical protein
MCFQATYASRARLEPPKRLEEISSKHYIRTNQTNMNAIVTQHLIYCKHARCIYIHDAARSTWAAFMPIDTSNTRFAKTEPPCLGHPARAAQPALGRVLERTFSNPDPNPQHPALPSPHPRAPCPTFTTRLSPPSSGAPPDLWSALTFPAIGRAARPSPARSGDPRAPRPTFSSQSYGTARPREPCPSSPPGLGSPARASPCPSGALPDPPA